MQEALQAIHCHPLHFLAWEASWNPRSWFCQWQAVSSKKTGSSPQPMNDGGKQGALPWHPRPRGIQFPGPHDGVLTHSFLASFLSLAYSSALVSASWNHLLNQLPVFRSSFQVCSWSNRNWEDHTEKQNLGGMQELGAVASHLLFCSAFMCKRTFGNMGFLEFPSSFLVFRLA